MSQRHSSRLPSLGSAAHLASVDDVGHSTPTRGRNGSPDTTTLLPTEDTGKPTLIEEYDTEPSNELHETGWLHLPTSTIDIAAHAGELATRIVDLYSCPDEQRDYKPIIVWIASEMPLFWQWKEEYRAVIDEYVRGCPIRLLDITTHQFVMREDLRPHIERTFRDTEYVCERVLAPIVEPILLILNGHILATRTLEEKSKKSKSRKSKTKAEGSEGKGSESRKSEGGKARKKKKKKTRGPNILPPGEYSEELVDIIIEYQPKRPASPAFNLVRQQCEQHIGSLAGDKREWEQPLQILVELVFNISNVPLTVVARSLGKYSILSHRWMADGQEVIYDDILEWHPDTPPPTSLTLKSGFAKFSGSCQAVAELGYQFIWIDSLCIDKTDQTELQKSISSMFAWYRNAYVCIVHLAATTTSNEKGMEDPWFSRGWTLQEVIAPRKMKVYLQDWTPVVPGTKYDVLPPMIYWFTSNQDGVLGSMWQLRLMCIELHEAQFVPRPKYAFEVFRLMKIRETTNEEDMVYSVLSLLGVELNISYGEGFRQAFYRLQRECLSLGGERQLLFWHGQSSPWNSMLSDGFKYFLDAEIIDLRGLSDHEIHFMSDGVVQLMMALYTISETSDTGMSLADNLKIFIEFNVDFIASNSLELKFGRFSPYSIQGVVLSLSEPDSGERKVYQRVGRVYLWPGQETLDHKPPEWVYVR